VFWTALKPKNPVPTATPAAATAANVERNGFMGTNPL
jgi:hypothetical protein